MNLKKKLTRRSKKDIKIGNKTYLLYSTINEGGQGIVYLVKSNEGENYALKKFSFHSHDAFEMARREISLIKLMSGHKNCVKVFDSEIIKKDEELYEVSILMEYCYEPSVSDLLKTHLNKGLPEEMIYKISADTTCALKFLHKLNPPVIHRDIKIENILQNSNHDFVLIDFGSATRKTFNPNVENAAIIQDEIDKYTTLAYRSPEMIDLYGKYSITYKSDIWALGCMFYKLLFNVTPFGENKISIQTGKYTFPNTNKTNVHQEYTNLIKLMLSVNPDSRPSITEIDEILSSIINKTIAQEEIKIDKSLFTKELFNNGSEINNQSNSVQNKDVLCSDPITQSMVKTISNKTVNNDNHSDDDMMDFISMRSHNPSSNYSKQQKQDNMTSSVVQPQKPSISSMEDTIITSINTINLNEELSMDKVVCCCVFDEHLKQTIIKNAPFELEKSSKNEDDGFAFNNPNISDDQ